MTRNWDAFELNCNICNVQMRIKDQKLVMGHATGPQSVDWLDIHICPECEPMVIQEIEELADQSMAAKPAYTPAAQRKQLGKAITYVAEPLKGVARKRNSKGQFLKK